VIETIYQDVKGTLWVSTYGSSFNKFNAKTASFTHYRVTDGLPNDTVYSILPDQQGNLWLSHNVGLSKFNPNTETFRNYDVSDGLQSNEFNQLAYPKPLMV
jgi:streptogramin lyase